MKIKLSTVLSIAAGAGVVITGFLAARGGRKAAEIEFCATHNSLLNAIDDKTLDLFSEEFDEKATAMQEEAIKASRGKKIKCYLPAIASGIVTIGCGAYAKCLDTKEIIKLTGAVGVLSTQLKRVKETFNLYRNEVVHEVGPEKESEIRKTVGDKLVKSSLSGLEEKEYVFRIDWANGKEIFFKSTPMMVMLGIGEINRLLNDIGNEPHAGCPTVSDFFYFIGQPEYISKDTDNAAWTDEECLEMDQWWIHADLVPYGRQDFTDQEAEYYDIAIDMYPNGCIENDEWLLEHVGTL